MLPPVCFTCGDDLEHTWWTQVVPAYRRLSQTQPGDEIEVPFLALRHKPGTEVPKSHLGQVLDDLGITRICCRTSFLTVDDPTTTLWGMSPREKVDLR